MYRLANHPWTGRYVDEMSYRPKSGRRRYCGYHRQRQKDNILPMLLAVDSDTVCTRFIPASKPVSSVKKWIAHSEGFAKGEIHINKGAEEALTAPKATSVLLVGVTRIEGDFEKDDIVKIMNEEGVQIGVGCTAYDSEEARKQIGQRDLKPLIHYDYLYLD